MIEDLIRKTRSYRKFYPNGTPARETMEGLINLARLSASAGNLQPLKYFLSIDAETNDKIFPCLSWAGYLTDWPGPAEGQRPAAYIVILGDTRITKEFHCDHGIAAQSIMLGAVEQGLGGCIIGSINKNRLREALKLDGRYKILLVLALGKPRENVVIEEVKEDDIKYWRDEKGVHHVPKRSLKEIILN